jgi:hypothetical protein
MVAELSTGLISVVTHFHTKYTKYPMPIAATIGNPKSLIAVAKSAVIL